MTVSEIHAAQQTFAASIPGVLIREMALKDADAVYELERQTFASPWSRQSIEYELANNPSVCAFVAEQNGRLVGYVIGWVFLDEGHIGTLAVAPAVRRNKIGSALLSAALAEMTSRQVTTVYLEVRRSNAAAQKLYFKHGFEVTGVRKNYYSKEKEDALVLSLHLQRRENDGLV
jgi:ribosomal-protein-alanine N-acetyltransferase